MGFLDALANNFGSAGDTSALSAPDQLADVQRRQQLAQALISAGSQQPRMINAGPFTVAPGIGGTAASVAQILAGALASNRLNQQSVSLQGKQRADLLNSLSGVTPPAQPILPPAASTQPPPNPGAPTGATPPQADTGGVSVDPDGMPSVTVTAAKPAGPMVPPAATAAQPAQPAALADPDAQRRAMALRALSGLPNSVLQSVVAQNAMQELQPRPLVKFSADEGLADGISGRVVKPAGEKPESEIGKIREDQLHGIASPAEADAAIALKTMPEGQWVSDGSVKRFYGKNGQPVPGVAPIKEQLTPSQQSAVAGGSLSADAIDGAARRVLNGEPLSQVIGNMGRGQQGANNITAVQNRMYSLAQTPEFHMQPEDFAQKIQELGAEKRARMEIGAREGKMAPRVEEVKSFATNALQSSANVPRGNWRGMNSALQWGAQQASDPAIADFQIKNTSLINAWAAAIGGGVMHVEDQKKGAAVLATADGPEAYAAKVRALIQEANSAQAATGTAMDALRRPGGSSVPAAGKVLVYDPATGSFK